MGPQIFQSGVVLLKDFLFVGLGGSLGAIARYCLYLFEKSFGIHGFPFATLVINSLGCFVAGMLLSLVEQNDPALRGLLLFLVIGFLGSFTTFSAFSVDNYQLLRTGQSSLAILNMVVSLFFGIGSAWLGHKIRS